MSKKKTKLKFVPHHHRQISHFISDLPLREAITQLDDSEEDLSQFSSSIIDQNETEALIEMRFTDMVTLSVILEDWARGSQTKVSIYREKRRDMQRYVPKELHISRKKCNL